MFFGHIARGITHWLDWLAQRTLPPKQEPSHLRIGRKGEDEAYYYLRKRGYVMVDRNFRSPRHRGEIDLIGWDGDVLCFIEVKTRTTHDVKPAEAAVDAHKRRELAEVARAYRHHLPDHCQWRFDVVSVYLDARSAAPPKFEIFRNSRLTG